MPNPAPPSVGVKHYYNEWDSFAAQWLRNLIADGLIPNGDVDERSIADVQGSDLDGYTQCHFFAGIAGWPLALQLAGWPTDVPVWSGSCPCQPFSSAGKGRGAEDERHLWPEFARLIAERRPSTVFGEQVASKAGRSWLAGVFADLEALGYRRSGADLCAAGVNAPHIRQRLWWVADAGRRELERGSGPSQAYRTQKSPEQATGPKHGHIDADRNGGAACGLGHAVDAGLQRHAGDGDDRDQSGRIGPDQAGSATEAGSDCWSNAVYISCADGKARRIESGLAPLAHGVSPGVVEVRPADGTEAFEVHRAGSLKGFGNAIVPPKAAEFIAAYLELMGVPDAA